LLPTPPSDGISARTDYAYDPLGRVTQVLAPAFVDDAGHTVRSASWTVYDDVDRQQWTAQGSYDIGAAT